MAPKKKAAGKKGKAKGGSRPPSAAAGGDGVSVEVLQKKLEDMKTELDKNVRERNYFQLERDKVTAFWEISKRQLDDAKADMRNKDRLLEEQEERHQIEMKVYKQKVRHLLYEHKITVDKLKTEGQGSLKLQDDDHRGTELELKRDNRSLKQEMKEDQLGHEDMIRKMRLEHDKNVTKLRQEFELQARELQQKYENKMKLLREELEMRRKVEIHEIEERKNEHIQSLMQKHDKAFREIKSYYNDITTNNLDLIRSLTEEVEDMKKTEAKNEKLMFEIAQENKRLSEPLTNALSQVEQLKAELANYQKERMSLKNTKARLKATEGSLKTMSWEHDTLEQRFRKVQQERDELYEKFEKALVDVQQRTGFKNLLLEKKLQALTESLEKKEAQLGEILKAANLDPTVLGSVTEKLEDILDSKNRLIKDLEYELSKVTKAHNDAIRAYESKLQEFGIPAEELGFTPLLVKTGAGPAGLVAS